MTVTLVVDGDAHEVQGDTRDGSILVTPDALREATGWELRPEGFCRGDVCVPRHVLGPVLVDDMVDIVAFGTALRRPVAFEPAAAFYLDPDALPSLLLLTRFIYDKRI